MPPDMPPSTEARAADQSLASAAQRGQREGPAVRSDAGCSQEGLWSARRKKAFGQVLAQRLVQGLSRQAYLQGQRRHAQRESRAEAVVQAGIRLGRDALFDVLRNARMPVPVRRAYHKTTDSHHRLRRHPDLLKAGDQPVCARASEQVWVADITYLPTADKFVDLSLVTDAHSRKIVGWHVHDNLQTEPMALAPKMALRARESHQRLVHHSDRGIQYCSSYYQSVHQRHGLDCSMTDG